MQSIRIIEIPRMKAVYSGPLSSQEKFERFISWFSNYHQSLQGELFPRDFMWYNEKLHVREWFYALPANANTPQVKDYDIVDLPSGLFAVASCLDADLDSAKDWQSTREEVIDWVDTSGKFDLYRNGAGKEERYPMFQIVSPGWMQSSGVSIEDLYVPIVTKRSNGE